MTRASLLRIAVLSVLSSSALPLAIPAARAQASPARGTATELEEIVVTASKREERLQLVPQTITAISDQTIRDVGAQDFTGLLNSMAGVEMRNTQAGLGGVAIRGVAELNISNLFGGSGSATGLYLDEIPLTSAGIFPDISSFDLARVEVLKGPQGTLFGEGSLAGTVRLISNAPDPAEFAAAADFTFSSTQHGEDNEIYNGMLNVPLGDRAAVRVVGFKRDMGGYIDTRLVSTGAITEDTNFDDSTGGRASLRFEATDRLRLDLTAMTTSADRGSRNRATENYVGSLSVPEQTEDDLDTYNGTLTYAFDAADLVVTASYFDRSVDSVLDQAGLVGGVNFVFGLIGIPIRVTGVYIDQDIAADTTTAEARLVSTKPGPLQWTVGAFYKDLSTEYSLVSDGVPSVPPQVWTAISQAISGGALSIEEGYYTTGEASNEQLAAFGEASYEFADAWQVVLGGRLFNESRDSFTAYGGVFPLLTGGPPPGTAASSGDETLFNPRGSLRYRFGEDAMAYATISRGFRSGGQNDLFALVPGGTQDYDPETLTNYELGLKSGWMDGRLIFNAALFYLDWQDLQAVTAEGAGGIGETIGNIGNAHSLGVDLELRAAPLDGLELALAATLLEAETDEAVEVPDPAGGAAIVVPDGTRIPRTAEQTLSASVSYRFAVADGVGFLARATYSYVGDSISSITRADETVPSRSVLDLRAGIEGEKWGAYVFADNLNNEDVYLFRENFNDVVTGQPQYFFGRPRTVGINLRVSF